MDHRAQAPSRERTDSAQATEIPQADDEEPTRAAYRRRNRLLARRPKKKGRDRGAALKLKQTPSMDAEGLPYRFTTPCLNK